MLLIRFKMCLGRIVAVKPIGKQVLPDRPVGQHCGWAGILLREWDGVSVCRWLFAGSPQGEWQGVQQSCWTICPEQQHSRKITIYMKALQIRPANHQLKRKQCLNSDAHVLLDRRGRRDTAEPAMSARHSP